MAWDRLNMNESPAMQQISEYIDSPLWEVLLEYVEGTYEVKPLVEYSRCSGEKGWNVKYRRGGKALCTLYPHEGYFTCLICIGSREDIEASLVVTGLSTYMQELYKKTAPHNGTRWLMIDVKSPEVLEDVQSLLYVRAKPKKASKSGQSNA
jgi:hypothetical protein